MFCQRGLVDEMTNAIILATKLGADIAALLLANPVAAERNCIFNIAVTDSATFNTVEAQVILPDRPTEYLCSFQSGANGTVVKFKNQNGWKFQIALDKSGSGNWTATKDNQSLSGKAHGLP